MPWTCKTSCCKHMLKQVLCTAPLPWPALSHRHGGMSAPADTMSSVHSARCACGTPGGKSVWQRQQAMRAASRPWPSRARPQGNGWLQGALTSFSRWGTLRSARVGTSISTSCDELPALCQDSDIIVDDVLASVCARDLHCLPAASQPCLQQSDGTQADNTQFCVHLIA